MEEVPRPMALGPSHNWQCRRSPGPWLGSAVGTNGIAAASWCICRNELCLDRKHPRNPSRRRSRAVVFRSCWRCRELRLHISVGDPRDTYRHWIMGSGWDGRFRSAVLVALLDNGVYDCEVLAILCNKPRSTRVLARCISGPATAPSAAIHSQPSAKWHFTMKVAC